MRISGFEAPTTDSAEVHAVSNSMNRFFAIILPTALFTESDVSLAMSTATDRVYATISLAVTSTKSDVSFVI